MKTKSYKILTVILSIVLLVSMSQELMAANNSAFAQGGFTSQVFKDMESFEESVQSELDYEVLCSPTLAQLKVTGHGDENGGMCYVVQLSDGRFIIIDGGYNVAPERPNTVTLLNYLDEMKPDAHEKPVIACWMLTHGHGDHYNNMMYTLYNYVDDLVVESLAYTFPDSAYFDTQIAAGDTLAQSEAAASDVNIQEWNDYIVATYPDVDYWEMESGDSRTFADVKIDILMDAHDRYPIDPIERNDVSAVWKMTFTQGTAETTDDTSFMVLGDSPAKRTKALMDETSTVYVTDEVLKSDVLQVTHHGLSIGVDGTYANSVTSQLALYQKIDPTICLWPTYKDRFETDCPALGAQNVWLLNKCDEQNYHGSQITIIDMSDLSVTVKDAPTEDDDQGGSGSETVNCTPTLAQMQHYEAGYVNGDNSDGMCNVIQLTDGRFIIIDAGLNYNDPSYNDTHAGRLNALKLLEYMNEKKPASHEKPIIACWMLTSINPEHFNNLYYMSVYSKTKITVECLGYNFTTDTNISGVSSKLSNWNTIKANFASAELWEMTAGEVKTFADVTIDVLLTADENYPEVPASISDSSAVWKMTFTQNTEDTADDTSYMVLGDSPAERIAVLMDSTNTTLYVPEDELKSDVLQVANHGITMNDAEDRSTQLAFYQAVDPQISLWPTCKDRFDSRKTTGEQNQWLAVNTSNYHNSQTAVIDMTNLTVTLWGMGVEEDEVVNCTPTLAQMRHYESGYANGDNYDGMCNVIQLTDGRFIIIDAGLNYNDPSYNDTHAGRLNALSLLQYLEEKKPDSHEKPVIACWMLTSYKPEHFNNLYYVAYFCSNKVIVENFGYNFTDDIPDSGKESNWATIKNKFGTTTLWEMSAGETKTFADVKIDVLLTADEKYPTTPTSIDDTSAVWKMTFTQNTEDTADDTSYMVLGDSPAQRTAVLMDSTNTTLYVPADELKSDVLQVANHGIAINDAENRSTQLAFYQAIDPAISLWATCQVKFEDRKTTGEQNQWLTMNTTNYHNSQTTVINMSDLTVSTWIYNTTE